MNILITRLGPIYSFYVHKKSIYQLSNSCNCNEFQANTREKYVFSIHCTQFRIGTVYKYFGIYQVRTIIIVLSCSNFVKRIIIINLHHFFASLIMLYCFAGSEIESVVYSSNVAAEITQALVVKQHIYSELFILAHFQSIDTFYFLELPSRGIGDPISSVNYNVN